MGSLPSDALVCSSRYSPRCAQKQPWLHSPNLQEKANLATNYRHLVMRRRLSVCRQLLQPHQLRVASLPALLSSGREKLASGQALDGNSGLVGTGDALPGGSKRDLVWVSRASELEWSQEIISSQPPWGNRPHSTAGRDRPRPPPSVPHPAVGLCASLVTAGRVTVKLLSQRHPPPASTPPAHPLPRIPEINAPTTYLWPPGVSAPCCCARELSANGALVLYSGNASGLCSEGGVWV